MTRIALINTDKKIVFRIRWLKLTAIHRLTHDIRHCEPLSGEAICRYGKIASFLAMTTISYFITQKNKNVFQQQHPHPALA